MNKRSRLSRLTLFAILASLLGGCAIVPLYPPHHGGGHRGPGYYQDYGPGYRGGPPGGMYR